MGYINNQKGIIEKFYIPALQHAVRYDRVTGYFSPQILLHIFKISKSFIENKGKMRLIIGCELTESEYDAIAEGHTLRNAENTFYTQVITLINSKDKHDQKVLNLLKYLVAENILDIKVAYTDKKHTMLHSKFGVFIDKEDNSVAFNGSANETFNGLNADGNIENIDVFTSWDETSRVTYLRNNFENFWQGDDKNLYIYDIPSIAKELIIKHPPEKIPRRFVITV